MPHPQDSIPEGVASFFLQNISLRVGCWSRFVPTSTISALSAISSHFTEWKYILWINTLSFSPCGQGVFLSLEGLLALRSAISTQSHSDCVGRPKTSANTRSMASRMCSSGRFPNTTKSMSSL